MSRKVARFLTLLVASLDLAVSQQKPVAPATELIQYVALARKAGLKDAQIQRNAIGVGWPEDAVIAAINSKENTPAKSTETAGAGASATLPASPAAPPREPTATHATEEPKTLPRVDAIAATTPEPDAKGVVNRGVGSDYQIGAGDILQISVWKEPDASVPSAVVRPDGKISLPLLKEVSVLGLTPKQAELRITEQLGKLINGADVTVVVSEIHSQKIYLVGAVKKEGPLPYTYRMSVMQAISEGGGLTDYAKRKKIYVLRTENGRQFRLAFNYDAVLKGERMEMNHILLPGDTVVIPN